MKKKSLVFLILAGLFVVAGACSSSDSSPEAAPETTSVPTTTTSAPVAYDVPGSLELTLPVPDVPVGTILDTERLDLGAQTVGYRFLYSSRSIQDEPIAVSGYVVSKSSTPPAGGWPLVAWAHGTVGTADKCAPSHDVVAQQNLWQALLDAGYAVVATDYEGLGTPGLHPYIVGDSEARGVFDSVRAVQDHGGELGGIEVSEAWVAWGHSQGGHTTMHVAQRWQEYAPELDLRGSVAGAPPSQFDLLYLALLGGPFQGYIAMVNAAYEAAYPNVDLSVILADEALALLPVMEEECTDGVFEAYNPLTAEQLSRVDNPLDVEPIKSITVDNDPKNKPVQTPLLIIHGSADEQIPFISSEFLLGQLCILDSSVPIQRLAYDGETHGSVIPASASDMLAWIADRFEGAPAPNDC